MTKTAKQDSILTGSLAKGLAVLGSFSPNNPSMSVSEIAARVDLNRATAYRIASVLASLGFLEQVDRKGGRREYRPGLKVLLLGRAALESLELPELALPYLQELQENCGETVNMAILDEGSIVYILRLKTDIVVNIRLFVGSRLPAQCTSMGKAMLAFLSTEEFDRAAASLDFTPLTERSTANLTQLRADLEVIRQRGFAINDQELAAGLRSVAAPIFHHKRVVAAINIAIPSGRVGYDHLLDELGPAVRNTAQRISNHLSELSTELISAPKVMERSG
jgi:IclR family transcriptional regulator, pca regulon regulatory protein